MLIFNFIFVLLVLDSARTSENNECPENEEYKKCVSKCEPSCNYPDRKCRTNLCDPGCQCRPGFLRDESTQNCVPKDECVKIIYIKPFRCAQNEIFRQNGTDCATCQNYKDVTCPVINKPGCFCVDGYVRNKSGHCVSKSSCREKILCGPNEVYKLKGYDCGNCNNFETVRCVLQSSEPGCYCLDGYVRDLNGTCVPKEKCSEGTPSTRQVDFISEKEVERNISQDIATSKQIITCGVNMVYSSCINNACPADCDNKDRLPCPETTCRSGCVCQTGFVASGTNNYCVPPYQCPSSDCPSGERRRCQTSCETTCTSGSGSSSCYQPCFDGCFCDGRRVRDTVSGRCIEQLQCPGNCASSRNLAYSTCGKNCTQTCGLGRTYRDCSTACSPGCYCAPGYVLSGGICRLATECFLCSSPKTYQTTGEVCTCSSTGLSCSTVATDGCYCPAGSYSNSAGQCVAKSTCNSCSNGKIYSSSGGSICACNSKGTLDCITSTAPGCYCPEDYYPDSNGVCKSVSTCPKFCPAGQSYMQSGQICTCIQGSGVTCEALDEPGCYCPDGEYKDSNGVCISKSLCILCRGGQVYMQSGGKDCICLPSGRGIECVSSEISGCYCPKDYYLNELAVCAPKEQCPTCPSTSTYNALGGETCVCSEKGLECETTSSPGCFCEGNYYLDSKNECVLKSTCTPGCPIGQTYSLVGEDCVCQNGKLSCEERQEARCRCPPNQYMTPSGICVSKSTCSGITCPAPLDYYSNGELCICDTSRGLVCAQIPQAACYCPLNSYKDANGQCVDKSTCKVTCPELQTYETSGEECICGADNRLTCQPKTLAGCYCPPNYYKNPNNVCVLKSDCTGIVCPAPKAYKTEGEICVCGPKGLVCTQTTIPDCYCSEDKYVAENGTCILKTECQITCSTLQTYEATGGEECVCSQTNELVCTTSTVAGCYCPADYFKNPSGECVLKSTCSGKVCPRPQTPQKPGEKCICSPKLGLVCSPLNIEACYCPPDMYKDPSGQCVDKATCMVDCQANAEYTTSGEICICTPNNELVCSQSQKTKCYCRSGYYLNSDGQCVRKSLCSGITCPDKKEYQNPGELCVCDAEKGLICTTVKEAGCYCPPDSYEDSTGKCVLKASCSVKCPANSMFSPTGNHQCLCYANKVICNTVEEPGCYCNDDYYLDLNTGTCVPSQQCTSTCPDLQEFGTGEVCICDATTYQGLVCVPSSIQGCYCKSDDYYMNPEGACVLKSSCNVACPGIASFRANEESCICNSNRELICQTRTNPGCHCPPDFYFDISINQCVLKTQCTGNCPEGKTYSTNGQICVCDPAKGLFCLETSTPGCYCSGDSYTDSNGACVQKSTCKVTCPEGQTFETSGEECLCDLNHLACQTISSPGCYCSLDSYKNLQGQCVLKTSCTDTQCGPLQNYQSPGEKCICSQTDGLICASVLAEDCYCPPTHYKNNMGECVLKTTCQILCPKGKSYLSAGQDCICHNDNTLVCTDLLKPGCYCGEGFYDDNGQCVDKSECTGVTCPSGQTHEKQGEQCICDAVLGLICVPVDEADCYCPPRTYKDPKGNCVDKAQCVPICPGSQRFQTEGEECICQNGQLACNTVKIPDCYCEPGSYFDPVQNECVSKATCVITTCPRPQSLLPAGERCICDTTPPGGLVCITSTIPGCYCVDGTYLDANKKCVSKDSCPYTCPLNEAYLLEGEDCICNENHQLICEPIKEASCYCPENYYRDGNGQCVLKNTCRPKCADSQVYQQGGERCICSSHGLVCITTTIADCYCPANTYKNSEGKCVPKRGCGIVCRDMKTYQSSGEECICDSKEGLICTKIPKPDCYCPPDYYEDGTGKCIRKDTCKIDCPRLQTYQQSGEDCICTSNNKLVCRPVAKPGCYCPENYYATAQGCLLKSDCTQVTCLGNQNYQGSGEKCICDSTVGLVCVSVSTPNCYCPENQYKDSNGECVDKLSCAAPPQCKLPKTQQDTGEYCICSDKGLICTTMNVKDCYCPENYYLNPKGECVLKTDCPSITCLYPQVNQPSGENCICDSKLGIVCTNQMIPDCYCPEDSYKDSSGKCVPKSSCQGTPCDSPKKYQNSGEQCICNENQLICNTFMVPNCYCPKDTYQDANGKCVDKSSCSGSICKPPKAPSPQGEMCICSETGLICEPRNVEDCYCPSGYYIGSDGTCVEKSLCTTTQCTGIKTPQPSGEVCICDSENILSCAQILIEDCYCPLNYYEDPDTGECVLKSTCVKKCDDPLSTYEMMGEKCVCDKTLGLICVSSTLKGCYCPEEYYLDGNGKCVLKSTCPPPPKCRINEAYLTEGETCKCDQILGTICTPIATPGCYCLPGYYLDDMGQCVIACKTCPKPQSYQLYGEKCVCDPKLGLTCVTSKFAGCYCPERYYKETNGNCVMKSECKPPKCPDIQVYQNRGKVCKCTENGVSCEYSKKPGCYCPKGYFLGKDGKCIPDSTCPTPICKKPQIYNSKKGEICICQKNDGLICKSTATPGCYCPDGYYKETDGTCVSKSLCCNTKKCPGIEVFKKVGEICVCSPDNELVCTEKAVPDCYCPDEFYYDANGACVPKSTCTGVPPCPANAYYGSVGEICVCDQVFGLVCTKSTTPDCYCSRGYYMNPQGVCVLKSECVPTIKCPGIKEYALTGRDCVCSDDGKLACKPVPEPGCYCPENYYSNLEGLCDLESSCTGVQCGLNQTHQSTGENCICSPTSGLICSSQTIPQCYCPEGYYKDPRGVCVEKDSCAPSHCPKFEIYEEVGELCICTKNKLVCSHIKVPGCHCEAGYYRDRTGKCVPKHTCTSTNCKRPKTFSEEGERCVCTRKGLTCKKQKVPQCYCPENYYEDPSGSCVLKSSCPTTSSCTGGQVYQESGQVCSCKNNKIVCVRVDKPGCYCPEGFYSDKDRKCVPESSCTGTNCKSPTTYQLEGEQCYCTTDGLNCIDINQPGCYCPEGQYMNKQKKCVDKSTCDRCEDLEIFQDQGEDCICKNNKLICRTNNFPGCYCPEGHYRDENEKCVHKKTCSPITCPGQQIFQTLGEKCICDQNKLQCVSTAFPDCYCPKGFYKEASGKCVPKESCTKDPCPGNQILANSGEDCICDDHKLICTESRIKQCYCPRGYYKDDNGICKRKSTCSKNGCKSPLIFSEVGGEKCLCHPTKGLVCVESQTQGCYCPDGYYMDSRGKCVSKENCTGSNDCPKPEIYSKEGEDCVCDNSILLCASVQNPGCYCPPDHYKNEDGDCVPKSTCTPTPHCPPPEKYQEDGEICICNENGLTCSHMNTANCYCPDGYYKNSTGVCVRKSTCKRSSPCKEPKVYKRSGEQCTCDSSNRLECTKVPQSGCYCPNGYYEDDSGKCLPKSKCRPKICRGLQVYKESGERCICDPIAGVICSLISEQGCYCPYPYYKSPNGTCVPISSCKFDSPCDENQIYDTEGEECVCDPSSGLICTTVQVEDCYCPEKHYYKDQKGKCVKKSSCPRPNLCPGEVYKVEGESCICDEKNGLVCVPVPIPQCYCLENQYRDANGDCVDKSSCSGHSCKGIEVFKPEGGEQCVCRNRNQLKCTTTNIAGCYCPEAFYRNSNNVCVKKATCSKPPRCEGIEVFQYVGEKCLCDLKAGLVCSEVDRPDCYCPEEYYRDNLSNKCIKKSTCKPLCGENEEFMLNEGIACTCNKKFQITCKKVKKSGCYCLDGYYRDASGACVSNKFCRPKPCPGIKERKEIGEKCICTKKYGLICKSVKIEKCYCPNGYYEDSNGECLLKSTCITTCPGIKTYQQIGEICTCTGKNLLCKQINKPDCYCPPDYYMDGKGLCILKSSCTGITPTCPGIEVKRDHGELCLCKNDLGLICSKVDITDCYCPEGYYRDSSGNCVLKRTCLSTPCEGIQTYQKSGEECICESNAATIFYKKTLRIARRPNSPSLVCTEVDSPGCYCPKNYYKDPTGLCVKKADCHQESPCRGWEVFKLHGERCICDLSLGLVCESIPFSGCYCPKGTYKDANGECIDKSQCVAISPCTGDLVYQSTGEDCSCSEGLLECLIIPASGCYCPPGSYQDGDSCIEKSKCTPSKCPEDERKQSRGEICVCSESAGLACTTIEKGMCYCKKGMYRDAFGICVDKSACYNSPCPEKEVFQIRGEDCICDRNVGLICKEVNSKQCYCQRGYYRNNKGVCVKKSTCKNNSPCPGEESWKKHGEECICDENVGLICSETKIEQCYCPEGHYRDPSGSCVLKNVCSGSKPCNGLQSYRSIGEDCVCHKRIGLVCLNLEIPDCYCPSGYYKNKYGECVKKNTCKTDLSICPYGESFQNGGYECICDKNKKSGYDCVYDRRKGCYCPEDHVRNIFGTCVPSTTCSALTPSCDENETYQDSGLICVCDRKHGVKCVTVHKPNCYCLSSHVRDENGNCVPKDTCNLPSCPGDQIFQLSGTDCICDDTKGITCSYSRSPKCYCPSGHYRDSKGRCLESRKCLVNQPTCEAGLEKFQHSGKICICEKEGVRCIKVLKPGCYCLEGLMRDESGKCVPISTCPRPSKCPGNKVLFRYGRVCHCDPVLGVDCELIEKPGCYCRDGQYEDESGNCVDESHCSVARHYKGCTELNEHYSHCGSLCPRTCLNWPNNNLVCETVCVEGCFCKPGYVRDTVTGGCVTKDQCPIIPFCTGANEVFQETGKECECDKKEGVSCVYVYKSDCYCKKGFFRNEQGECVPEAICSHHHHHHHHHCGRNEIFDPCPKQPGGCRPRCGVVNTKLCHHGCFPSCICKPGFILTKDGSRCIPYSECDDHPHNITCDKNEKYVECENPCQPTCADPKRQPCPTLVCSPGCHCKKGYRRQEDGGPCVKCDECARQCPPNEKIGCKDYCPATCSNPLKKPCRGKKCHLDCICDYGYVRNSKGKCILKEDCPPLNITCGINEQPDPCVNPCPPTCDNPNRTPCPTFTCSVGCSCRPGFIREVEGGKCVPLETCPNCNKCSKPNEELGCKNPCAATCQEPNKTPCIGETCIFDCVCKRGYVRDQNGVCILKDQCTIPPICKANEVPTNCIDRCEASCENLNPMPCRASPCVVGCQCAPGYVRSFNGGDCIPINQCKNCSTQCLGASEELGCQNSCPATCEEPNKIPCTGQTCIFACVCKPGYVRDRSGVCILLDQCPPPTTCPANERLTTCVNLCQPTCSNINANACPSSPCKTGCECIPGYVRNATGGVCVPVAQCTNCSTQCTGPNQELGCQNSCPATCDRPNQPPCLGDTCIFACVCRPGYVQNSNGVCIPINQCPGPTTCPANEKLTTCVNLCQPTCNNINATACPSSPCKSGCECIPGYVRNSTGGPCVPVAECFNCTTQCTEPNQELGCQNTCPATCDNPNQKPCWGNSCIFACICKKGYVKNKNGVCILRSDCGPPGSCQANEQPSNCANCERKCETLTSAPACDQSKCLPGCECKQGYARSKTGVCIPEANCTSECLTQCPLNEEIGCTNKCRPTCQNMDRKPCKIAICNLGCVCKHGFIRNEKTGMCIPKEQCFVHPPHHTCGRNEIFLKSGKDCATCQMPNATCPVTNRPGCYCRPGYVRNASGHCIRIDSCPQKCGPNEIYMNTGVDCGTCKNPFQRCPPGSSPGCYCKRGFVKNDAGRCVHRSTCHHKSPCGPNEVWQNSGSNCNTCKNPHGKCPIIIKADCYCKPGFVREYLKDDHDDDHERNYKHHDHGRCVPKEDCPSHCGKYEVYKDKGGRCGTCEDPEAICDKPGCYCLPGFVRENDHCIKLDECTEEPAETCGRNEIFRPFGRDCQTCENPDASCSIIHKPRCYCKPGYVRNDRGRCIHKSRCEDDDDNDPKKCGPNEIWNEFGKDCATCDDPYARCPEIEKSACYCRDGYVRDKLRRCILRELCVDLGHSTPKPPQTCGANEVFTPTGYNCATCDNYKYVKCSLIRIPGCYCIDGYVRDHRGSCIDRESCDDHQRRCGPNEVFKRRGTNCKTCENPDLVCPVIEKPDCYCKDGFIRNQFNQCVLEDDCENYSDPSCGPNEYLGRTGYNCSTCQNYKIERCPLLEKVGCYCKEGYVRNSRGLCVSKRECEDDRVERCEENEIFKLTGYDCATCRNYKFEKCKLERRPSCFCKDGFVRNRYNKCVPHESCFDDVPTSCGPHEVFQRSGYDCANCKNYKTVECSLSERPGCYCREGFVRGRNDRCVPIEACEAEDHQSECGPNEIWKDNGYDCESCAQLTKTSCPLKNISGCYCKDGYIRNFGGECISRSSCGKTRFDICEEDEEYQRSGFDCLVCNSPDVEGCILKHKSGCYCKSGLVRNRLGKCVTKESCDADPNNRCGVNEIFKDSGFDCATCDNYQFVRCALEEKPDCYCLDSYVRNHLGQCVETSACDQYPHKRCDVNEIYKSSGFDCATCDNYKVVKCALEIRPDCYCLNGYVRDRNGKCVTIQTCENQGNFPNGTCGRNEEFKQTGYDCATCTNYKYVKCALQIKAACYCRDGFVRNKLGRCVPITSCEDIGEHPQLCGPNEVYLNQGSDCQNCNNPEGNNCNLIQKQPGCYCAAGYLRNSRGICVKPESCDHICGPLEEYSECGSACPDTCENYNNTNICITLCVKGCFCKPGLVRDTTTGRCVPTQLCPTNCRSNEEYLSCSCDKTCLMPNKNCTNQNCRPGCYCRQGFVRDPATNRCIREESCPQTCQQNEIYKNCGCNQTCSNLNCNTVCNPGCYCKDGWVRDESTGRCILKDLCVKTCDPTEEYLECSCEQTCLNWKDFYLNRCNQNNCHAGCFCKNGLVRDLITNRCIPKIRCIDVHPPHPPKCGLNEVLVHCNNSCQATCDEPDKTQCTVLQCRPGCVCRQGYVRYQGKCIPLDQCPSGGSTTPSTTTTTHKRCKKNEIYKEWGVDCATCDNYKFVKCAPIYKPGCYCLDGYVRDKHGYCVTTMTCEDNKCKQRDPYSEYYYCAGCNSLCPGLQTLIGPSCTPDCKEPGCRCKKGFYLNKEGKCGTLTHCIFHWSKDKEQLSHHGSHGIHDLHGLHNLHGVHDLHGLQ